MGGRADRPFQGARCPALLSSQHRSYLIECHEHAISSKLQRPSRHRFLSCETSPVVRKWYSSSANASGSNPDLHPTPIDYGLFEQPESSPNEQQSGSASSSSGLSEESQPSASSPTFVYETPSPVQVIERMLQPSEGVVTAPQLSEAFSVLAQFQALQVDFSEASSQFYVAADLAIAYGHTQEAIQWLHAAPRYSAQISAEASQPIRQMLQKLVQQAGSDVQYLEQSFEVLLAKFWHTDKALCRRLKTAFRAILQFKTSRKTDTADQWWQYVNSTLVQGQPDATPEGRQQSQEITTASAQRKSFLTYIFNAVVRHLMLEGKHAEAVKLLERAVDQANVADSPLHSSPPISRFTYVVVIESLLNSETAASRQTAHDLHRKIVGLQERTESVLSGGRQHVDYHDYVQAQRAADLESVWTSHRLSQIKAAGPKLFSQDKSRRQQTSIDGDLLKAGLASDNAPNDSNEQGDVRDARIIQLASNGDVESSREVLLSRLSIVQASQVGDANAHLPSARCLAAFQAAVAKTQPQAPLLPLDAQVQEALLQCRGGKGFWELGTLIYLAQSGFKEHALNYYLTIWHPSPILPVELVTKLLGKMPEGAAPYVRADTGDGASRGSMAEVRKSGLLWPSSHASHTAVRTFVGMLDDSLACPDESASMNEHLDKGSASSYRKRIANTRKANLIKITHYYGLWRNGIVQAHQNGSLAAYRLGPRPFDEWRRIISREAEKLEKYERLSWRQQTGSAYVSAARGVDDALSKLRVFKNCALLRGSRNASDEHAPFLRASPAVKRSLEVLLDMQELGLEPETRTWSSLFNALGRDSAEPLTEVHSEADKKRQRNAVSVSWDLAEHLAAELGMLRGDHALSEWTKHRGSDLKPEQKGSVNVRTYISLIRGLMDSPWHRGGPVTGRAEKVSEWLRDAIDDGRVQLSDEDEEDRKAMKWELQRVSKSRNMRKRNAKARSSGSKAAVPTEGKVRPAEGIAASPPA